MRNGWITSSLGNKFHYKDDKRHNDNDEPAIIFKSGSKRWYKNGQLHRLNGPAVIWSDGDKYYWINGKHLTKEEFDKQSQSTTNEITNWKKYQEGVLKTESIDLDKIKERLSVPKTIRLMHAAIGKVTEAGEFIDQLKKHVFYGKELDEVNLAEEIGDGQWYDGVALDVLQIEMEDIWHQNNRKLVEKRYKNGFSEEAALNRDLDAERKTLENCNDCKECTCNNTIEISEEELAYQMRPQLEE